MTTGYNMWSGIWAVVWCRLCISTPVCDMCGPPLPPEMDAPRRSERCRILSNLSTLYHLLLYSIVAQTGDTMNYLSSVPGSTFPMQKITYRFLRILIMKNTWRDFYSAIYLSSIHVSMHYPHYPMLRHNSNRTRDHNTGIPIANTDTLQALEFSITNFDAEQGTTAGKVKIVSNRSLWTCEGEMTHGHTTNLRKGVSSCQLEQRISDILKTFAKESRHVDLSKGPRSRVFVWAGNTVGSRVRGDTTEVVVSFRRVGGKAGRRDFVSVVRSLQRRYHLTG